MSCAVTSPRSLLSSCTPSVLAKGARPEKTAPASAEKRQLQHGRRTCQHLQGPAAVCFGAHAQARAVMVECVQRGHCSDVQRQAEQLSCAQHGPFPAFGFVHECTQIYEPNKMWDGTLTSCGSVSTSDSDGNSCEATGTCMLKWQEDWQLNPDAHMMHLGVSIKRY